MGDAEIVADVRLLTRKLGQFPEPAVRPVLIVVSGLPGTGKSYFPGKLAERLHFLILESDALRKALFSPPLHTAEESARLFRAINNLIEQLLERGISLILDATNLTERHRERLYNIADRLSTKLILVRVEAPPEVVRQRLKARAEGNNPEDKSEADWSVYQEMKPTVQDMQRKHYAVDTSREITPVLDKILKEANR